MELKQRYSPQSLGIMFIIISHCAWLWEGIVTMRQVGSFVNRGFLHGFWLPLYGFGSLFLICVLGQYKDSFWKIFFGSAIMCGAIEYGTGLLLEKLFHHKWWTYGDRFMSFDGRTCGGVILVFGLAGYFLIRYLAPYLNKKIQGLSITAQNGICVLFGVFLALDFLFSLFNPNVGYGITF